LTFAPDTEAALQAAVSLVNTGLRRDGVDAMATIADLDRFYVEFGYAGRRDRDDAEVAEVRAVRDRLRPLFSAGRDEAAEMVNGMLREATALPYLTRHDQWDWHLHATPLDAPVALRIIVEAAMGFVDVIRSDEYGRVAVCAASDCQAVLVDLSRNRSRRFCDVNNCANRAHVAAYRARRAADGA
jgi:predicted RNA-binding Zn ribbon-like protein